MRGVFGTASAVLRVTLVVGLTALAACGDGGSSPRDAGRRDSGANRDTGTTAGRDSGPGSSSVDAATVRPDAAVPFDAFRPTPDAYVPRVDSGRVGIDTGFGGGGGGEGGLLGGGEGGIGGGGMEGGMLGGGGEGGILGGGGG